jgi:hypothetical protein
MNKKSISIRYVSVQVTLGFILALAISQVVNAMGAQEYGEYVLTTIKEGGHCNDFRLHIKDIMSAGYPNNVAKEQINKLASTAKRVYCTK